MAKEETKDMKFDFETVIRRLDGEPMYEQDEHTGQPNLDKPFKMRSYIGNLLWQAKEKEEVSINNAVLALRIYNSKTPITLKVEERSAIKALAKKTSSPGVMLQVDGFLEGTDPFNIED